MPYRVKITGSELQIEYDTYMIASRCHMSSDVSPHVLAVHMTPFSGVTGVIRTEIRSINS